MRESSAVKGGQKDSRRVGRRCVLSPQASHTHVLRLECTPLPASIDPASVIGVWFANRQQAFGEAHVRAVPRNAASQEERGGRENT